MSRVSVKGFGKDLAAYGIKLTHFPMFAVTLNEACLLELVITRLSYYKTVLSSRAEMQSVICLRTMLYSELHRGFFDSCLVKRKYRESLWVKVCDALYQPGTAGHDGYKLSLQEKVELNASAELGADYLIDPDVGTRLSLLLGSSIGKRKLLMLWAIQLLKHNQYR